MKYSIWNTNTINYWIWHCARLWKAVSCWHWIKELGIVRVSVFGTRTMKAMKTSGGDSRPSSESPKRANTETSVLMNWWLMWVVSEKGWDQLSLVFFNDLQAEWNEKDKRNWRTHNSLTKKCNQNHWMKWRWWTPFLCCCYVVNLVQSKWLFYARVPNCYVLRTAGWAESRKGWAGTQPRTNQVQAQCRESSGFLSSVNFGGKFWLSLLNNTLFIFRHILVLD